jgi:hypothetical protein
MTKNSISDGISEALYMAFGNGCEIYTNRVKQGFKPPCFSVSCVEQAITPYPGGRYHKNSLYSVVYTPENVIEADDECMAVSGSLFNALEYINTGSALLRGTGMSGRIVDGVLVFTINYNAYFRTADGGEPMDVLSTVDIKSKG